MTYYLRWILMAPAAIGSSLLVAHLFEMYYSRLAHECVSVPELPKCHTPWYIIQVNAIPTVAAVLSAVTLVLVAYAFAPAQKTTVARYFFAAGASVATLGAIVSGLLFESMRLVVAATLAVLAGFVCVWLVSEKHRRLGVVDPIHGA